MTTWAQEPPSYALTPSLSSLLFISTASSMLRPNINLGTSTPRFATLPALPPAPQPAPQLFWEPPVPLVTAEISPRNPLVLSTLPRVSLVGGDESRGLGGAVPLNMAQVGAPGRPSQPVHNSNIVLTQAPHHCSVSGAPGRDVEHHAPLLMATPPMNNFVSVPATAASQPREGPWVLGPHSPAQPPVVQLLHMGPTVSAVPHPQGAYGDSGLGNLQTSPQDDLSKPESAYGNFRHQQHIETLVRSHVPQTPDVEAFSCFLL